MPLANLNRDEIRAYAVGEWFYKIKGEGAGATFESKEAEIYAEAFVSAVDKLNKENNKIIDSANVVTFAGRLDTPGPKT